MLIPFKNIVQKYGHIKRVFHCGMHWAEEAPDYYNNGVEFTNWIEAEPSAYKIGVENLTNFKNFRAFNNCIGETDGEEVNFYISNNQGQSSSVLELDYHKIAHPEVNYTNVITLKTKRLDSIYKENNLTPEDLEFINMDLQGFELIALKSLGELLHYTRILYLEVNKKHLYKNCPLIEEIDEYVAKFGFKRVETVWAGNTGWGDCLMIKE